MITKENIKTITLPVDWLELEVSTSYIEFWLDKDYGKYDYWDTILLDWNMLEVNMMDIDILDDDEWDEIENVWGIEKETIFELKKFINEPNKI